MLDVSAAALFSVDASLLDYVIGSRLASPSGAIFCAFPASFFAGKVSFVASMISAPIFSSGCVSRTLYRFYMRYVLRHLFLAVFFTSCVCAMCFAPCVSRHVFRAMCFAPCVSRHVFHAMCFAPCVSRHVFRAMCFALCVSRFVFRALCYAPCVSATCFSPRRFVFAFPSLLRKSLRLLRFSTRFAPPSCVGALLWRWSDVRHLSRLPLDIPPSGRRFASRLFYGDACLTVLRRRRSSMTPLL